MSSFELVLPTASLLGFIASILRVGAFIAATPYFSRRLPAPGRLALALALSLVITEPIVVDDVAGLLAVAAVNIAVGLMIGFVTGITFHAFFVAGSVIDLAAGLGIGATFDPVSGATASVFDRFFDVTAVVVFLSLGGDHLIAQGMHATTQALPLDATVEFSDGLQEILVDRVGVMLIGMLQIAAPAIVALLITEVALGIASRLLPRANVFLVGMPARLGVGLIAATAVITAFPTMMGWLTDDMGEIWSTLLRAIRPT